ncbi:alpha-ketoglutarate-dependent dioxygenase alkB homolog 7, mitochondrial isoform X2 [Tiliqua scincoides]|uniref:alpha-ketoglutarate-dependent dioxygenase alkB homolog 7, mitochondrial isoform X2 n=1 Tax=Tiliqua scincoides TaxID=71010 RepID=UPI0034630E5E
MGKRVGGGEGKSASGFYAPPPRRRQSVRGGTEESVNLKPGVSMFGAIHKYRETEKSHWSKESHEILQRVRDMAFPPGVPQLTQVHVLDLDKAGYIKPHIDSVKFCGCTIAGLSLLSSSVMRLAGEHNPQDWLNLLLERRSLYILRGPARYEFTHEILKDEESFFDGRKIHRERRISVICRNLPVSCDSS